MVLMKTPVKRSGAEKTAAPRTKTSEASSAKCSEENAETPSLEGVLDFLKRLAVHNDRDWFNAHKGEYLEVKAKVEALVEWLLPRMTAFDKDMAIVDPRKCMYRIYRDIRFSPDKRPYKDHIGIGIASKGRHGICSGYYIHLQPGASFVGAGIYGLDAPSMKKIRDGIYFQSKRLLKILAAPDMKKFYGGQIADYGKMKLAPKGYDKDFPDMDLLKYKHYFVEHPLRDQTVSSSGIAATLLEGLRISSPFHKFLNEALDF